MAYCSEDEVRREFKNINWVTIPGGITADTITEWTEQESAFIDSYLGATYLIPVNAPQSLLSLKKICIFLTSSRVKKALQVKNIDPVTQNQVNDLEYNAAIKYLEGLKDGSIILPDAPRIEIASSNQKVFHNMVPPIFNKDKVQW